VARTHFIQHIFAILQEIKIFAWRFSTSVARQVFRQRFRSTGRFGDSIARPPNLWPGIQVSAGTIDLRAAKQMPVHALENCERDPAFVGSEHKRIAGYIEARQDFLRCRPPVKCFPENRAFLPLAGSCRRHFGCCAGNPNRQPEIQKIRWKSVKVAELFCSCVKFQIFS